MPEAIQKIYTLDDMMAAAIERQEEEKAARQATDLGKFLERSKLGISKFKRVDVDVPTGELRITYQLFNRIGKQTKTAKFLNLGGYSYLKDANRVFGQLGVCVICNHSSTSLVNDVCMKCSTPH